MNRTGILVLNFGEPENPVLEEVTPFLEAIFRKNASLEASASPEAVEARARELALARAPTLVEEYREIGGSPLNAQARWQARALEEELRGRGVDARSFVGMQFLAPTIRDAVREAREAGVERLVALPVYPLCGRSTTVAALEEARDEVEAAGWEVELLEISGWHRHPDYVALHADHVRQFLAVRGVSLDDPGTRLVFSAHGTPVKYLDEGNRYDVYVEEFCSLLADALGVEDAVTGFQNHTNRPVEWTQPDVEEVVRTLDAERAVVVAVSFMHEQSETLAELDGELAGEAREVGIEMHRVPVPHDHPRFVAVLADLVQVRLGEETDGARLELAPCRCRPHPAARCLNAVALGRSAPRAADSDGRRPG